MNNIKPFETFDLNENWYSKPEAFETLEQIDVYLGPMRKTLIIDIKGNKAEFTKEEVDKLLEGIEHAKKQM